MFVNVKNETSKCPWLIINRLILVEFRKKKENICVKGITVYKLINLLEDEQTLWNRKRNICKLCVGTDSFTLALLNNDQ